MAIMNAIKNGLFIFLVFVVGSQNGIANEHLDFENLIYDGCLFEAESLLTVAASETEPIVKSAPSFSGISDLISQGIVFAQNAAMSTVADPDATANLSMVVANSFDAECDYDSYWRYYRDCDRWHVSFGAAELTVLPTPIDTRTLSIGSTIVAVVGIANIHWQNVQSVFEDVEYSIVENLPVIQTYDVQEHFDQTEESSPFRVASYSRNTVRAAAPVKPNSVLRPISATKILSFSSQFQPIVAPVKKLIDSAKARYEFIRCFFGLVTNSSMCRVSPQLSPE